MKDQDFDQNEPEIIYVSKSELKRDMEALQKLGERIIKMKAGERDKLGLTGEIAEAIELGIKIKDKKDAFRRHIRYVAKVLNTIDLTSINEAIFKIENNATFANVYFHKLEQLRDDLVKNGDSAINEILTQYPDLDRGKLRQLVRQTKKEAEDNKPPKSARQIFQYLKEMIPQE